MAAQKLVEKLSPPSECKKLCEMLKEKHPAFSFMHENAREEEIEKFQSSVEKFAELDENELKQKWKYSGL